MDPPWSSTDPSDAGGQLTPEQLYAAARKIRDAPPPAPHGTPGNPHLISPGAFDRGYGRCVQCGLWVSAASPN